MKFSKLNDVQGYATALKTIRTSEASIRDNLNEWGVVAIAGVIAGDNVKQVNDLIACFGPVRGKRLTSIISKFLPFSKGDDGAFDKKDQNVKTVERKVAAFEAFAESNETLYNLLESAGKAEKKPVDYGKAFTKAASNALENGLTADQLLTLLNAVTAAAAAAEIGQEKEVQNAE